MMPLGQPVGGGYLEIAGTDLDPLYRTERGPAAQGAAKNFTVM
jgi:hypothetical protein